MDKPLLSQHLLLHCIFLLTMLKRQYMVSCKPSLAAPDSQPLINANIQKCQVSEEDGLIMLARNSAKHLNQTYKALQGVGVVDPGSVK